MLKQGMSFRAIGRHYGIGPKPVIDFIERMGLQEYRDRNTTNVASTETYSETGRMKMHIRWHVRRNKPNMNCVYCQRHEGFDSPEAVKADERIHICANPRCGRQFKSQRDKYCSDECHDRMKSYSTCFHHIVQCMSTSIRQAHTAGSASMESWIQMIMRMSMPLKWWMVVILLLDAGMIALWVYMNPMCPFVK